MPPNNNRIAESQSRNSRWNGSPTSFARLPAKLCEWTAEPELPNCGDEGMQDVDVLLFRPDYPINYRLIRKQLVSRFSGLFKERAGPLFFQIKTYGRA